MKSTNRAGRSSARAERAPARTFFRGLEHLFEDAWDRAEGRRRVVSIGGVRVALRFAEGRLDDLAMRCLGHIEVVAEDHADAAVDSAVAETGELPWSNEVIAGDGETRALVGGRVWVAHDPESGRVEAVDPLLRRAIAVFPDPGALAPHELASPLRASLLRLVDRRGVRFLHAGAVSAAGGAALLVGPSGSGKSTLALACLGAGLGYLGDDYVAISEGRGGPHVCSAYASAKLDERALELLGGGLRSLIVEAAEGPKKALFLPADRVVARAPLAAVVVPSPGGDRTRIEPVSPAHALLAMAPSTMIQHPGRDAGALTEMRDLVTATPCWKLTMDRDPHNAAAAVRDLLG